MKHGKYEKFPTLREFMTINNFNAFDRISYFAMYREDIMCEGKRFNMFEEIRKELGGKDKIHEIENMCTK
jgi:hypothetical protein